MTKKQKEKNEDIIVSFADSMSVQDVTGSSVYVEYRNNKILLECGLHHAHSLLEGYNVNKRKFNFKVKELDYVFILHNHIDHIGRLPVLYKNGCSAKIIIPKGSKDIMIALLLNSAMICNGDAKLLSKNKKENLEPIFTEEDVWNLTKYITEVDIYEEIKLNDYIKFKLISSGHVAKSTSLVLQVNKNNIWKTIYYTSDLGNVKFKNYYVNNLDRVRNADLVISECTYGDKTRACADKTQRNKDIERIDSVVKHYCNELNGKVLIPVFSFSRAQTIATLLYEMYSNDESFDIPIYMDSTLMLEINKIFKKQFPKFQEVMNWKNIKEIDKEARKEIINKRAKAIILASSGMLVAGASISYLRGLIESDNNCIIFCGYCSEGSIGAKLKLKTQKTITIFGEKYKNKIQICKLKSFSSHIQYDDLIDYLSSINCDKIALHHGDKATKLAFKSELEEVLEKKCRTNKVLIPTKSTKIRL